MQPSSPPILEGVRHPRKKPCTSSAPQLPQSPSRRQPRICFLFQWIYLPTLDIPYKWSPMWSLAFGFIHSAYVFQVLHALNTPLPAYAAFIQSSVELLDCFHFLVIMSHAAVDIQKQMFAWRCVSPSLGGLPVSGSCWILDMVIFSGTAPLLPKVATPFCIFPSSVCGFQPAHQLTKPLGLLYHCYFPPVPVCGMSQLIKILISISLMAADLEHLSLHELIGHLSHELVKLFCLIKTYFG